MTTFTRMKDKTGDLARAFLHRVEIVIFYTEILTRKVVLWYFFMSETSEKIHNSTFRVKISV